MLDLIIDNLYHIPEMMNHFFFPTCILLLYKIKEVEHLQLINKDLEEINYDKDKEIKRLSQILSR